MKIGSRICAVDGTITEVIGVFPQGVKDIYRIEMSDGGVTEACADHIWLSWGNGKRRESRGSRLSGADCWKNRTTKQLIGELAKIRPRGANSAMMLPLPNEPIHLNGTTRNGPKREIDPYLLGLLLGDGTICNRAPNVVTADKQIADFCWMISSGDCSESITRGNRARTYRFIGDFRERLIDALESFGLDDKKSQTKFVPRCYLWADDVVRRSVLQGLMDTDGHVKDGAPVYSTTSPSLRDDVIFLVRSLGGSASYYAEKIKKTQKCGLPYSTIYRVGIRIPNASNVFRLTRKKARCRNEIKMLGRSIKSITPSGKAECVCIAVAHPSSLYITDDFIVTHNTDCSLGRLLIKSLHIGKGVKGIFFRRTYKQLEEVVGRAKELYTPHGAVWKESSGTFTFPNGATIKFRYLDSDDDAQEYQGHSYSDLCVEELGNFPSPAPIMKLKATLRSPTGVPCQMFATGNPGGPGSNWIRARYIDPAPQGWVPITEVEERKLPDGKVISVESSRIYIPSRITDNKLLLDNDPGYLGRLMQSGSEELVRAWLDGDFYAIDGAFFDVFNQKKHVIRPFEIPAWWLKFRAMDWGSAKPFCNLWIAMPDEDFKHPATGQIIPRGALIVYREWYGVKVKKDGTIQANVGVKLFAEEVGTGIQEREGREHIHYGVLDPSAFSVDGGSSIAERMYRSTNGKVAFRRADNKRVGTLGALSGWDQVRGRLVGEPSFDGKDTVPMLYFFSNCHHILRTLPAIQHDPDNVEDIDTDSEDHAADALRYGCMSRPYTPTKPSPPKRMTTISDVTIDKLWYDHEHEHRSLPMRRI